MEDRFESLEQELYLASAPIEFKNMCGRGDALRQRCQNNEVACRFERLGAGLEIVFLGRPKNFLARDFRRCLTLLDGAYTHWNGLVIAIHRGNAPLPLTYVARIQRPQARQHIDGRTRAVREWDIRIGEAYDCIAPMRNHMLDPWAIGIDTISSQHVSLGYLKAAKSFAAGLLKDSLIVTPKRGQIYGVILKGHHIV